MDDVKTTVYLAPSQYEALRRLAFERRTSITELIRQAIDKYLAQVGGDTMYYLASNQADRIRFDEAVRAWAIECVRAAGFIPLDENVLAAYTEQFLDELHVDDLDEAEARFRDVFDKTWQRELDDNAANNEE